MQLLFDRLHHQPVVQQAYLADPAQAVSGYELTTHERDAVISKDLDDLVALGLAPSIGELPEVVRGTRAPGQPGLSPGLIERIRAALAKALGRAPGIDRRPDRPDIPRPRPRPEPGPGPGPRPGPGPDPPDPVRRPRGPGG
jgi:hypothetical protein